MSRRDTDAARIGMFLAVLSVVLCTNAASTAAQEAAKSATVQATNEASESTVRSGAAQRLQQYVEPIPFRGSLVLFNDEQQSLALLKMFLTSGGEGKQVRPLVVSSMADPAANVFGSPHTASLAQWLELRDAGSASSAPTPAACSLEQLVGRVGELGSKDAVWLVNLPESVTRSREEMQRLGQALIAALKREVRVVLSSKLVPLAGASTLEHLLTLDLLDSVAVSVKGAAGENARHLRRSGSGDATGGASGGAREGGAPLLLEISESGAVELRGRTLRTLSEDMEAKLTLPATPSYPQPSELAIAGQKELDFTTWRRARVERSEAAFPGEQAFDTRLAAGSMVIVGGGGATPEIWQTFIDLAGGKDAKIIILPTAVPEPSSQSGEARLLERMGVKNVKVLPQIARDEVSSEEYLAEFKTAGGVWFGGGRQWHFVDAYWGTPAWNAILDVVHRGGVVAGSSAGATIQGDLLVRGHPHGNQIMIADGYRHGLGLVPGLAIDQHFKQRNRFADLVECLKPYPNVLGVGIDESTALVVEAPNRARVIGSGSVWVLPKQNRQSSDAAGAPADDSREAYIEYPTGSSFELDKP